MTGVARLLRETVERAAKKQVRSETKALKKSSALYRKAISDLSTRVREMERELAALRRQVLSGSPGGSQKESGTVRFSAKGLRSLRKKLALSKTECGQLLGVSAQAIGKWESGLERPPGKEIEGLAAIRKIGKREARMRLREKKRLRK